MISPGAVAAATGLSGGTSATPGSRSKYFSRLIGSGANRATIRELVVDIDFQTTLDQPIDLSRYLHLLQKYGDKSISILPYTSTDESLTPITRTDDVPRGDDLLPYLAYPPKSMMVAGKSGQRIRLRLSSPYSVYQLKGKADLIKAFNAAGKRVYMKSVTCAATNLLRIGYLHGANPEVFPRDAAMLELGKRGLGTFDVVSAAKGRLGISKVSYSGFGVSTHAVTVYADESVAADWQEKLMDYSVNEADKDNYPITYDMTFVPFNAQGTLTIPVLAEAARGHIGLITSKHAVTVSMIRSMDAKMTIPRPPDTDGDTTMADGSTTGDAAETMATDATDETTIRKYLLRLVVPGTERLFCMQDKRYV